MLVHTEIFIDSLDIEIMVSAEMWHIQERVRMDYVYMTQEDSDVGPLSWDQKEFPELSEEIAMWLDVNYDKVEPQLWKAYEYELDKQLEAYQLRNT